MIGFRGQSIRRKLLAIIFVSALVPIMTGLTVVAYRDIGLLRRELIATAETVAAAAARYSVADLAFEDREGAEETLAQLDGVPYLQQAALFDDENRLFASRAKAAGSRVAPVLEAPPQTIRTEIGAGQLDVLVPVVDHGIRYGTLQLRSSTQALDERVRDHLVMLSLITLAVVALALAIGTGLGRAFSGRVMRLAHVARNVTAGDYSVRAPDLGEDELGSLAKAFNSMLVANEARRDDATAAVRVRDEFISIASHELKTPLTALKLQLQLLQRNLTGERPDTPAEILRRLGLVNHVVQRFDRLVSDLLDVRTIQAGRLPIHLEVLDLAEVVDEIAVAFQEVLDREHTPLIVDVQRGVVGRWDRIRLEQVATNLISNALKFGAGRPIQLRVDGDEDWGRFCVTDHGIGIEPKDLERIFDRYERAASSRFYGGLGLGLYISRTLVEALGGRIEVSSEIGRWTTFTVWLPREGPPADQAPDNSSPCARTLAAKNSGEELPHA